jgi:hypothetical protein
MLHAGVQDSLCRAAEIHDEHRLDFLRALKDRLPWENASAADSAAIMSAVANWERGWEVYDPELATRDYSAEADWISGEGRGGGTRSVIADEEK